MLPPAFPRSAQARFGERLATAIARVGISNSPTVFAKEFNLRSPSANITTHGARKWLEGEAIPTQERLQALADWLGVPATWLRFGDVEDTPVAIPDSDGIIADYMLLSKEGQALVRSFVDILLRAESGRLKF